MTIVLVPSTIALLPAYAGIEDPVPELRAACRSAVSALSSCDAVGLVAAPARPDNVGRGVSEPAGERIGRHLLETVGFAGAIGLGAPEGLPLLVVANGSARRGEKAPGHLDERAFSFDDTLGAALLSGDPSTLRGLDPALGEALWCHDVPAFHALADVLSPGVPGELHWSGDPYGVQYWVVTWP